MIDGTDKLEQEVIDELNEKIGEPSGNPFAAYCVQFPYRVEITLEEDDHNTRIQIDTKIMSEDFLMQSLIITIKHWMIFSPLNIMERGKCQV